MDLAHSPSGSAIDESLETARLKPDGGDGEPSVFEHQSGRSGPHL